MDISSQPQGKKMRIVYADSQFLLAAVHPSKIQFEIQRSDGSTTEVSKHNVIKEETSSCLLKTDNSNVIDGKDDHCLQRKEDESQSPYHLEKLFTLSNALGAYFKPVTHLSSQDSCKTAVVTAERSCNSQNIVIAKREECRKCIKKDTPVQRALTTAVKESVKPKGKILKTVLIRKSESMPEIFRPLDFESNLGVDGDIHYQSDDAVGTCNRLDSLHENLKHRTKAEPKADKEPKCRLEAAVKNEGCRKNQSPVSEEVDLIKRSSLADVKGDKNSTKRFQVVENIKGLRRPKKAKCVRKRNVLKLVKRSPHRKRNMKENSIEKCNSITSDINDNVRRCLHEESQPKHVLNTSETQVDLEKGSELRSNRNKLSSLLFPMEIPIRSTSTIPMESVKIMRTVYVDTSHTITEKEKSQNNVSITSSCALIESQQSITHSSARCFDIPLCISSKALNSKIHFKTHGRHDTTRKESLNSSCTSEIKMLKTFDKDNQVCYEYGKESFDFDTKCIPSKLQKQDDTQEFNNECHKACNLQKSETSGHFVEIHSNNQSNMNIKVDVSKDKSHQTCVAEKESSNQSFHLCQYCSEIKCLKSSLFNSIVTEHLSSCAIQAAMQTGRLNRLILEELSNSEANTKVKDAMSKPEMPPLLDASDVHRSTLENMSSLSSVGSFLTSQKQLLTATWNVSTDRPKWDATVDLYLHCDDVIFPVHRLVLVHFSRRLCSLLYNGSLEPKQVIVVRRVSSAALKEVLSWMYTGKINLMPYNIMEILLAALSLDIPELQKISVRKIAQFGDPIHFMQLVHIARCRNESDLAYDAMSLLASVFNTIVKGDGFLNFNFEDVRHLLSWDTLHAQSEYDVYQAAVRWLSYNWPHRKLHVCSIMNCVRFAHMTVTDLDKLLSPTCEHCVESLILNNETVKESLQIALLFKAYQAESAPYDFRYVMLPPRRFTLDEPISFKSLSECEVENDQYTSKTTNIMKTTSVMHSVDHSDITENECHQAVASVYEIRNISYNNDNADLEKEQISKECYEEHKADFNAFVSKEWSTMINPDKKSSFLDTKISIEEIVESNENSKSTGHHSLHNVNVLKSKETTAATPIMDHEATDLRVTRYTCSSQSLEKEIPCELDRYKKDACQSSGILKHLDNRYELNHNSINNTGSCSLARSHSAVSDMATDFVANDSNHRKVQVQIMRKNFPGFSKPTVVIVVRAPETFANNEVDQKSGSCGVISKSSSKQKQMNKQPLLDEKTCVMSAKEYKAKCFVERTHTQSELELSSSPKNLPVHLEHTLELQADRCDDKALLTDVGKAKSGTSRPKVVVFLKTMDSGVIPKTCSKNRSMSKQIDKDLCGLVVKDVESKKSSFSHSSFPIDGQTWDENEMESFSSALKSFNLSDNEDQMISWDSDDSDDSTPKDVPSHDSMSHSQLSDPKFSTNSTDTSDIHKDIRKISSSYLLFKNAARMHSKNDGLQCYRNFNSQECTYQGTSYEKTVPNHETILTECSKKNKLSSQHSSFSNWNADFYHEAFAVKSQHEKIGQKLTDPCEIFATISPGFPKNSIYNCVLLFGGRSKSNLHEYDKTCYLVHCYNVERETWHELGKMPAPRFDASACLYGDGIYVSGGVDPRYVSFEGCGKSSSSFWYLNLSDWSWRNLKTMPRARAGHGLVGLAKRLYAIGGTEHCYGNGLTSAVDVYDPLSDQWSFVAPLPVPLWKMATVSHGGHIWVCGGSMKSPTDFKGMVKDVTSDVYIYRRKQNVWVKAEHPLLHECAMASLVEMKEDLVLIGGLTYSKLLNRQELINELTVYLRHSGRWLKLNHMQDGRFSASVANLGNLIIIIGGRNARFHPPLNKVEIFNYQSGIWRKGLSRLPVPISNSAAVALPIVKCKIVNVSPSMIGS